MSHDNDSLLTTLCLQEGDQDENTFTLAINTGHRLHLPMMSRVVLVSIRHLKEYFNAEYSKIQINIYRLCKIYFCVRILIYYAALR